MKLSFAQVAAGAKDALSGEGDSDLELFDNATTR